MDAILLLLLLFWLFKSLTKRIKETGQNAQKQPSQAKRAAAQPADEGARRERAQRAVRMQEELKRREEARQLERARLSAQQAASAPLGEGMSAYAAPERMPMSARPAYEGSLGGGSMEGEDTCDPGLEHDRPNRSEPGSVYENEIGSVPLIDFQPQAILQGVVMSEVLSRPGERRWHRR